MDDETRDGVIEQLVSYELELDTPSNIARDVLINGSTGLVELSDLQLVQMLVAAISARKDKDSDDSICPPIAMDVVEALELKEKIIFKQTVPTRGYKC